MSITSPRCVLLQEDSEDDYFTKPSSYYRRGNLLSNTTSSFRQKCKRGFATRSRSSSYTSLDDEQQNEFLVEQPQPPVASPSFFSRMRLAERSNTALSAVPTDVDHQQTMSPFADDYDEDSFLFENKSNAYSRQALSKRSTSWKSSVLKAVGVKSK